MPVVRRRFATSTSGPQSHGPDGCYFTGAPPAAKARQLILAMGGHYASKKEVAYLLVPSIARKAIDLGGNVERGRYHL